MKTCSKCKTEKPKTEFGRHKSKKDGLRCHCKECLREYSVLNSEMLSARRRAYRVENPEKISAGARAYRIKNPEKVAARKRAYQKANSEKIAMACKVYYDANSEKIIERARAYYAENTEYCRQRNRAYRIANAEACAVRSRAYAMANPEKTAEIKRNQRARKRNAGGSHSSADIRGIFQNQRGLCANCQTKLIKSGAKKYHVDHIMPLSKGGSNDKYNLQCLCAECNQRKHAKDPLSWAAENGRLL